MNTAIGSHFLVTIGGELEERKHIYVPLSAYSEQPVLQINMSPSQCQSGILLKLGKMQMKNTLLFVPKQGLAGKL